MESLNFLLSVFLMGLLPVAPGGAPDIVMIDDMPLSPPAIAGSKAFPGRRLSHTLSASGVVILDIRSGQEMFSHDGDRRRPIGSLTKIMTAIIIAESHKLDETVVIPSDISDTDGSTANLPPGSHFTVGDLLSALLIASANDAAETLARFHSGSSAAFVSAMNERAKSLGLKSTSFSNPSGLDGAAQWSTPRNIAWMALYALRNTALKSRMSTAKSSIRSAEGHEIKLENTHALIGKDGVVAGKTGTTALARQCLLSLVSENGREYLVVLLGSNERYADLRAILRILRSFLA